MTSSSPVSAPDLQTHIAECQGLVHSLAAQIHRKLPSYVEFEDLVEYGEVGLAEAARDFDPSRGHQFSTFAYYRIRGAIYDGLAKMSWFSRAQYRQHRYEQLSTETLAQNADQCQQEGPQDEDSYLCWFRDLGQSLAVVYLATQVGGENELAAVPLVDAAAPPCDAAIQRELHARLHELIAALPKDAAALISGVYFEGLDLQTAGQRLGISKSWASRLHAKALKRLARDLLSLCPTITEV
jgi:RNA polymerase sigma factor FliA